MYIKIHKISLDSQLNHRLCQYTYKHFKNMSLLSCRATPDATDASSEESQNVLTLVSFTNNCGSGIDPQHFIH